MSDRLEAAIRELAAALRDDLAADQEPAPPADQLLSVDQAAGQLQIGRSLLYELIGRGQLRSISIGRRRLIPAGAVAAYVAGQAGDPSSGRVPDGSS